MQVALNEKAFENPVEENVEDTEDEKGVFFNPTEWKYFKLEIEDMMHSDREFSFQKAIHNARYLAIIDKGIEQMDNGGGRALSDEEIRGIIYADDFSR